MAAAKKSFGGAALLGKLAQKAPAPASKEGDTPSFNVDRTTELANAASQLIGAKKAMKQAESTIGIAEPLLLPIAADLRKRHCMDKQCYESTVKVTIKAGRGPDPKDPTKEIDLPEVGPISVSWQNRYSVIPIGDKEKLESIFGATEFPKCFRTETEMSVTEAGMKELEEGMDDPDGLLAQLVACCAKYKGVKSDDPEKAMEAFSSMFGVNQTLKPTEYLHEDAVRNAALASSYDKAVKEQVLKPVKASTRVR